MDTTGKLNSTLKELAESHWEAFQKPLLLSNLVPLLKAKEVDYKETIQDTSLKQFIKSTGKEHGYKLNEHPTQKEKIGVIPSCQDFTYDDTTKRPRAIKPDDRKKREETLISFFKILSTLPETDIEKVNIPASVIIKILK